MSNHFPTEQRISADFDVLNGGLLGTAHGSGTTIGSLNVDMVTSAPLRQVRSIRLPAEPTKVYQLVSRPAVEEWAPNVNSSVVVHSDAPRVCAHLAFSSLGTLTDHVIVFKIQAERTDGCTLTVYQYFNAKNSIRALMAQMVVARYLRKLPHRLSRDSRTDYNGPWGRQAQN